jgi:hypothetical protein
MPLMATSESDDYWKKLPKKKKGEIVKARNEALIHGCTEALLKTLTDDIHARLANAPSSARYTHVIVMPTGWNTPLWESVELRLLCWLPGFPPVPHHFDPLVAFLTIPLCWLPAR